MQAVRQNKKQKLLNDVEHIIEKIENAGAGDIRNDALDKAHDLLDVVHELNFKGWLVEGEEAKDEDCEFLREERNNEIKVSAEQGREFGRDRKEY